MYKDPEKQKEAAKEAMRRRRMKAKGITEDVIPRDVNPDVIPDVAPEVIPEAVIPVTPVIPEGAISEDMSTDKVEPERPADDLLLVDIVIETVRKLTDDRLRKIEERLSVAEEAVAEYRARLEELTACLETAGTSNARPAPAKRIAKEVLDSMPFSKHRQATGRMGRD